MRVENRRVQRLSDCRAHTTLLLQSVAGWGRRTVVIRKRWKYGLLFLSGLLCLLSEAALAQHPGCFWNGYQTQCPTPAVPPAPTISPSPSMNGSYTVSVYNADPYSWIELSTGESSRGSYTTNPTFSFSGKAPGTYSYRAQRCLGNGYDVLKCSSYSSATSVKVYSTPGAPSVGAITAYACDASLSFSWLPGSGYPSGSTAYYQVQKSVNGTTWTNVDGYTNTKAISLPYRDTTERATYRYRVRSRYYLNGGYSNYSGWKYTSTLTMPECAPGKPGTPSLTHANFETGTNVNISWTRASVAVGTVLGYRVQRYHSSTGWVALNACTTSGTSCTDSEAHTRGQTYQYRVQAYKSTVNGPWSTAASVTIKYATPAKPSTPTYSGVTTSGYTVNWSGGGNGNTGSISYQVWDSATASWISVGSATSKQFTGRSAATTYQHKVKACNPQSVCTESNTSSINIPGKPGAISISVIGDAGRDYTVGWSAAGGSVSSYELQRSINGGGWVAVSNQDGVLLSEAVSNATAGAIYQYQVQACNSQACGAFTSVRSYWVPAAPYVTPSLNTSTLSLTLSWPALPANYYQLDRSVNGGSWQSVSTSHSQTSYTTSVVNGYTYTYRVRACNADNACSANDETVSAVPPAAPATISASQPAPADRTDVTVSWSAVPGLADGYYLERSAAGGGFTQIAQIIGSGTLSYTDSSGLQPNTQYQYRVRAYKGSLSGAYSPASGTLRVRYTRPTVNLFVSGASQQTADVYSAGYNGIYTLNWSAGGSATSFNVTELEPGGAWQAVSQTALQCAANQCDYDKPFNDSGADHVYRYRGQACNVDYCSAEREVVVNVKTYPTPGPATNFAFEFDGTPSDGAYTLRWSAPLSTPPNVTGPNAEAVTHYQLTRTAPAGEGPWQTTHSDTRTQPYTRSFTGGASGQTYSYEIVACFTPNEANAQTVCSGASSLEVRIPYAPPNQPDGLNHTGLDAQTGDYTLVWNAASGQVGNYEIERLIDGQWNYFATATEASHPVTGHSNGQSRSYRVRACNVDDCGGYTAAHEVYVPHLTPGAPSDLLRQSLDTAERRMTLAWSAPLNGGQVQTYEIEQQIDGGSSWQATATTAGQTLVVNGLTAGTHYRFRVRACNVDACGAYGTELAAYLPYAAPGTPGAISHDAAENNPGQGAFTVRWTAPATIDSTLAPITYYQLEYSANGGGIWQAAPTGGATPGRVSAASPEAGSPATATLNGLASGMHYSVRVKACNADACGDNTAAYQVYLPQPVPGAPAWLPTSPTTEEYERRQFTVQWTPPAIGMVSHYQLEVYAGLVNGNDAWVNVAETPATAYAFVDRAYGETYRYRVRACSEPQSASIYCGAWAVSGEIRLPYPSPNAPGGIAVNGLNQASGSYTLSWNGVLGWAPKYRYQLQENSNGAGWQNLSSVVDPVQQFTVSNRTPANYRYRVRACNPVPDNDCSAWSPEAEVIILQTPAAPATLNVSDGNGRSCQFNVSWTPPASGQGGYHYELQINDGSWTSLAWTTGTTHNLMVNQANSDLPHSFRVRARSLSSGQYSAWSGWRTVTGATTSCDYSANSTTDQLYIAAPRYSSTGQYTVNMRYQNSWAPGLEYRYQMWTQGTGWTGLPSVTPPSMFTVTYGPSDPQPTNRYRYRIAVCDYDLYPNENPMNCSDTVDSTWDTLTLDTTVLRNPGSVGQVRIAGQPNDIEGVYLLPGRTFTLEWDAAPGNPGPATHTYEVQYKPDAAGASEWMVVSEQSTVNMPVTLPESGVRYDFRVRACARLDDYVNCGSWSNLAYPVRHAIGPPRYAVNTYPADGDLVIYDSRVPLQWLPPFGMASGGIDHYEVSLRSWQTDDNGGTFWVGPDVLAVTSPVTGSESDPPVQQTSVEIEQGGQKEFLIRACGGDTSDSCGDALVFAITVVIPPEAPEKPADVDAQQDPDMLNRDFNGALSGNFSVQPSGASSYVLPIVVPPGTAGVQPRISLSYNSQAGNGIAGWGWSLEGVSSISRCNKTIEQDGVIRGVDYTGNDGYCLDGQRLIEIGDNQYRTERTDFRRIERMNGGVCGTWFQVSTQAGETIEYGNTADACINGLVNANPVVKAWAINRVTDVAGNYMVYEYDEDTTNSEFTLSRIGYTGHEGGHQPYTWVDFEYVQRPDPIGGYLGGALTRQTRLLKRVETAAGAYELTYEPDEGQDPTSRLGRIDYCAVDPETGVHGSQCMQPLNFEWSVANGGWAQLPASYRPPMTMGDNDRSFGAEMVDLDNDGLPDLIYGAPNARQAYRNTGSGWQLWTSFQPPVEFVNGDGEDLGVRFADIDGNGYPDLLTSIDRGDGTYRVYRNTGSGWQEDASMALPESFARYSFRPAGNVNPGTDNGLRLEDLDGDGLVDLIYGRQGQRNAWRNTGSSSNRWTAWPQFAPTRDIAVHEDGHDKAIAWFADMNGDGRTDMINRDSKLNIQTGSYDKLVTYGVRLNTGSGWTDAPGYYASSYVNTDLLPDAGFRLADVNGDGLPDMLGGNPDDIVRINSGRGWAGGFTGAAPQFLNPLGQDNGLRFVDLNADGRADVLLPGQAWLSVDDGWQDAANFASPIRSYRTNQWALSTFIADVNGDGSTDIVFNHDGASGAWTNLGGRRQIVAVSDGLGNTIGIKYKTLTDRGLDGRSRPIYSRTGASLSTPREQEMNIPLSVVDRVTVNDGVGGELTTEYAYKGLTAAQGGRGLQGFEEMTVISPRGQVTTSRYARRYPFSGMPLSVEIRYGDGGPLLNRTVSEYCWAEATDAETAGFVSIASDSACPAYNDSSRSNESLFVYVKKTTIETHQLDDALHTSLASTTVVTRNTYGRYGYLTHSLTTTTGDGHTYKTETGNVYESNADRHWLGRLASATVTKTVDDAADANSTRKTAFEYYPDTGLLWKEKIEPGAGEPEELHTVHAYDEFGNIVETTVCAESFSSCVADPNAPNALNTGSASRSTTTVYDSLGRYPVTVINALDQSENHEYDHPLGLQTSLTGPNGIKTTWVYDGLGRKQQEITPLGTTTWNYYESSGGYAPRARYAVQTTTSAGTLSRVYYDGLGREVRQLTRNLFGEFVAADTQYDRFGRVSRSSAPYFVYGSMSGDVKWTINEYDGLDRPTSVQVPLGDLDADGADDGFAVSTTEVIAFGVATTDDKGRRRLTQKNALNQTVRVVDDQGGLNVEVEYRYDSQGGLIATTVDDNPATTITVNYNKRGHKEWMNDPDMGYWDYRHNGFGELVWQRDAKGQITEIDYDKLGRMTERREQPDTNNDGVLEAVQTSTFIYDTAPGAGVGKLHIESGPEAVKTYRYTGMGLLEETAYEIGSESFTVSHTYDGFGRMQLTRYPQVGVERFTVENVYSPYGGLWYVQKPGIATGGDDEVLWIASLVDARGQVMQEFLRNQNVINNMYNAATGWLQKVESWDKNDDMIQQTRYDFDSVGNVDARIRFRPWVVEPDGSFHAAANEEFVESFSYDSLDRLTGSAITLDGVPTVSKSFNYDRLGNFLYKDNINDTYTYNTCGAGPHAVCAAKGSSFAYDANGNMIASTGAKTRSLVYSAFNKPISVAEGGDTVEFRYGPDRARVYKRTTPNAEGLREITFYVGLGAEGKSLYEQKTWIDSGGTVVKREHQHFIYAGGYHKGQAFAMRAVTEEGGMIRYAGSEYYHRDHLGSVIAITDDMGVLRDASGETRATLLSYDAWGKLRNPDGSDMPNGQYQGTRTNRLYTGHESVPEVGLIHMNGRVYDPELGVFLSPDSYIQAEGMSQNYHRYSYVLNNPIRYNDPSGHFITLVVGIIVSLTVENVLAAMAIMFVASYIETGGDLKAALISALSVGIAHGIGTAFNDASGWMLVGKSAVHGLTQGIFTEMQGGDFRDGFIGGFLGSLTGPIVPKGVVEGTIVSAMVGGTISELTGGKFLNGARSAAIVHLFNDLKHYRDRGNLGGGCGVNMSCVADPQALKDARIEAAGRLALSSETKDEERGILLYIDREGNIRLSDFLPGNRNGLEDWHIGGLRVKDPYTKAGMYGVDGEYQIVEIIHNHLREGGHGRSFSGGTGGDVYISESLNMNVSLTYGSELYLYKPTGNVNLKRPWTIRPRGGELVCNGCFP